MTTLYITDLDGTLLTPDARVSDTSAAIISDLSRRGALISVATARTPATVVPIMADTFTAADLVVMTGAAMWDRRRNAFDSITLIPEAEARIVAWLFDGSGVAPFIYTLAPDGGIDVYHPAAELSKPAQTFVDERRCAFKRFIIGSAAPEASLGSMILAFGMGSEADIKAVAARLSEATTCYVSYYKDTYNEGLWLLEVFAHGVSKAAGVKALADRLGADRIVAFGDNLNDLPMLAMADVAVAVGNALPEVRAAADVVIGTNSEDAVARFILNDYENAR